MIMVSGCPHINWSKFQSATIFQLRQLSKSDALLGANGLVNRNLRHRHNRKVGNSLRHPVRHRPPKSHQHYNVPEKTKVKIKHKITTKNRVKWWEWPKEKKKVMKLSQQPSGQRRWQRRAKQLQSNQDSHENDKNGREEKCLKLTWEWSGWLGEQRRWRRSQHGSQWDCSQQGQRHRSPNCLKIRNDFLMIMMLTIMIVVAAMAPHGSGILS